MMNNKMSWPIVFVLIIAITGGASIVKSDDDDDEESEHHQSLNMPKNLEIKKLNFQSQAPVNAKFKAECSSCHMLYPPNLLPERSWKKMMGELKNHFGENAELDAKTQQEVTDYLIQNSSDKIYSKRGSKISSDLKPSDTPIRISQTTYFIQKHDELSPSVFKRKSIGSAANCIACHSGAEKGDFSEDNVRIPKDNEVKKIKK